MTRISVGGHRGQGCTDSPFALERNAREGRLVPAENTLDSIRQAFLEGASFIETDVVATADDEIVLTHANDLRQHVFTGTPTRCFVDEMTLAEVQRLGAGPKGNGRIPSLRELLRWAMRDLPSHLPSRRASFLLNLELKGVQATPRLSHRSLAAAVLRVIEEEGFPLERLRFSSFSPGTLEDLAARAPQARLGMLYTNPPNAASRMFIDRDETYAVFSPTAVLETLQRLPRLEAVHPEITTLTGEGVDLCAQRGLAVTAWASFETSPATDEAARTAASEAIALCRAAGVHELDLITDYREAMQALVEGS